MYLIDFEFCVLFNDDFNGNYYIISVLGELVLRLEDKGNGIKLSICLHTAS